MARRATTADLLSGKKAVTRTVPIVLDGEVADEWNRLQSELAQAQAADDTKSTPATRSTLSDAKAATEECRPLADEALREIELQAIGRKAYEELQAEHPPTAQQREKAKKDGMEAVWNDDTFPPALLAACAVDPKLTEDEARQLLDSEAYNAAETQTLLLAAITVNQQSKVVDLGKG